MKGERRAVDLSEKERDGKERERKSGSAVRTVVDKRAVEKKKSLTGHDRIHHRTLSLARSRISASPVSR